MQELNGGCHCGNLQVTVETQIDTAQFSPRACDCSFCTKHGAAYFSDPAGRLSISAADPAKLGIYRQGSEAAELHFCLGCGVLVAVTFDDDGQRFGAVNTTCLSAAAFAISTRASPQHLSAAEKKLRWKQLWFNDVKRSTRV